jgi:hypothetical protein
MAAICDAIVVPFAAIGKNFNTNYKNLAYM